MATPKWPLTITVGNSNVRVYRIAAPRAKSGFEFTIAWHSATGRQRKTFASEKTARAEARLKAERLNAGHVEAAGMGSADRDELVAARQIARPLPLLAAIEEWAQARRLCGGSLTAACEAWAARNISSFVPVELATAIDRFIAAKERAGHEGEATYRLRLRPLISALGKATQLHTITTAQLNQFLGRYQNGVTRNDVRKRLVTLWRWARDNGHLPEGVPLAIERTMRAKEQVTDIGIIGAETYRDILAWCRAQHPDALAALALAGLCGLRVDEIHGSRNNRELRQTWEDIYLDRGFLRVTAAKQNTPAWRNVPLCSAAVAWLRLTPEDKRKGPVCNHNTLRHLRRLITKAEFTIPPNCFRHSWISYRIETTHSKAQTAKEAGNSEKEIDRRYRVPVTTEEATAWFAVIP